MNKIEENVLMLNRVVEETPGKESAQMKRSLRNAQIAIGVLAFIAGFGGVLQAAIVEPTPIDGDSMRDLRPGYIQNWYIYGDNNTDGILNPGDQKINIMDNWWTSVSSGTTHSDVNSFGSTVYSAPYSHADYPPAASGAQSYAIPLQKRSLQFYMSYSQMDNNTAANYEKYASPPAPPGYGDFMAERHGDTNGWNFGWVINDYTWGQEKGSKLGDFDMDIYVHNGQQPEGEWISNPQVTSSNHMSDLADDNPLPGPDEVGNRVPPKWNDTTKAYDAAVNQKYIEYYKTNVNPGFSGADIVTIGQSMEVHEENPYGTYVDNDSIWDSTTGRTPNEIKANPLLDSNDPYSGVPYTYDDAFFNRAEVFEDESIGGVIAGLAGMDNYNPEDNNWGDQQVIRIDLAQNTLSLLDEIVIYDFGFYTDVPADPDDHDASQLDPIQIVFGVLNDGGYFRIFYDPNENGVLDPGEVIMPENRIYIARVDITPEPLSLMMLGLGGLGLLKIRSKRNRV